MFIDEDGKTIDKDAWLSAVNAATTIGVCKLIKGEDHAFVYTRYSGLDHDGVKSCYETGVNGSKQDGYHKLFKTAEDALADYKTTVAAIKADGFEVVGDEIEDGKIKEVVDPKVAPEKVVGL